MLFLSSTAFILIWFDISIFIFLKFIILGESNGGIYEKALQYSSVDMGVGFVKVKVSSACFIEVQASGGRANQSVIDVVFGLYPNEEPNCSFMSGSGECYYKNDGTYYYLVVVPTTSLDYSCIIARSNCVAVESSILNRTGFDFTGYSQVRNISFPSFYKNYADLSSLANALGAKRLNVRFDGDKKYVCDLYISQNGEAYLQDGYAQNIAKFPVTVLI